MGLVDRQNKIIYWDEVHWQWLPYVANGKIYINHHKSPFTIEKYQKVVKETYGLVLKPISEINCAEIGKRMVLNLANGRIITSKKMSFRLFNYNNFTYVGKEDIFKTFGGKNVDYRTFIYHLQRGWELEDALTTPGITRVKDHLGNQYKSIITMAKHYGISEGTLRGRLSRGWTLEKALTTTSVYSVKDHLGNTYKSETEMAHAYGLTVGVLSARLAKKWPLEKALTTLIRDNVVKDHLGNVYSSKKEMAEAYGIAADLLSGRLRDNWPLEKALTTPVKKNAVPKQGWDHLGPKQFRDHLGNTYKSQAEMAHAYGLKGCTLSARLAKNWPLEKALTTPVKKNTGLTQVRDHLGNTYKNRAEMARAYGLNRKILNERLFKSWPLEKALTTPVRETGKKIQDHLGNTYKNRAQMVKHYGISKSAFYNRLKRGWSLEKTLTTPMTKPKVMDHLGKAYESTAAMAKAYGITKSLLDARLNKLHWSLERALTTPIRKKK